MQRIPSNASEKSKKELQREIAEFLNHDKPTFGLQLKVNDLETVLNKITNYQRPADSPIIGERPEKPLSKASAPEYKEGLANYISINTGLTFQNPHSLSAPFLEKLADYFGL